MGVPSIESCAAEQRTINPSTVPIHPKATEAAMTFGFNVFSLLKKYKNDLEILKGEAANAMLIMFSNAARVPLPSGIRARVTRMLNAMAATNVITSVIAVEKSWPLMLAELDEASVVKLPAGTSAEVSLVTAPAIVGTPEILMKRNTLSWSNPAPDYPGRIPRGDTKAWDLSDNNRARSDDAPLSEVGSDDGIVPYPTVPADRDSFLLPPWLLENRFRRIVKSVHVKSAQDMDTIPEAYTVFYGAKTDVTEGGNADHCSNPGIGL
jgi:hypothetical protein